LIRKTDSIFYLLKDLLGIAKIAACYLFCSTSIWPICTYFFKFESFFPS